MCLTSSLNNHLLASLSLHPILYLLHLVYDINQSKVTQLKIIFKKNGIDFVQLNAQAPYVLLIYLSSQLSKLQYIYLSDWFSYPEAFSFTSKCCIVDFDISSQFILFSCQQLVFIIGLLLILHSSIPNVVICLFRQFNWILTTPVGYYLSI